MTSTTANSAPEGNIRRFSGRWRRYGAIAFVLAFAGLCVVLARTQLGPAPSAAGTAGKSAQIPPLVLRASESLESAEVERASKLLAAGDSTAARTAFAAIALDHPNDIDARVGIALSRWVDGGPQAAIEELEVLATEFPKDPSPRLHVGLARLLASGPTSAEKHLRDARALAWAQGSTNRDLGRRADDLLHPQLAPGYPPLLVTPDSADNPADRAIIGQLQVAVARDDRLAARQIARRAEGTASVEVQVAAAVAGWNKDRPDATVKALRKIASDNPSSGAALVELGLLELWSAHRPEGLASLRAARKRSAEPIWREQAVALLERLS